MTARYALLPEAEADLREVIRYTRKQWGDAQARTYLAKLKHCIECVVLGQGFAKDLTAIYPDLRMVHCEHHYIFCLPRADDPALVVAIFHEQMDLMTRVADRLR